MSREDVLNNNNQEDIETDNTPIVDENKNKKESAENTTSESPEYKQSEIEKTSAQTGEYLVSQGATCLCDQGEKIHLKLNVLSNKKVFLNDSSALATIDDNVLKGNFSKCKLNPSSGKPCIYQPKNKWDWKSGIQDSFSEVNGKKYLTDHAILKCPMFPGIISVSYNGQEIDVPESDKEDLDSSIDSSIICLMDDHVEPTEKQKKKKPNITSLSVLINEKSINSQSENIKKIYLRKDKEYEFTATDKKNVGYNYWYVREKQDTDTNPKEIPFFVDKGLVYEQTGSKAKFTFKENGIFYLEAFGTLANKKKIYNDCAFEIEIVDKNKINNIKLTPTEREKKDKTTLLLDKNTLYTIELQTLLPIEDEDLEGLSVEVHDTSIRFIPPGGEHLPKFQGQEAMRFGLKTADWGSYSLQIKRGEEIIKEYSFPILENEVKKVHIIDPQVGNEHWVRPGTHVTFEAELSDNKDERKRIYWKLDTSEISDEHDKRWKHLFSRTANHTVKASYRGFLGMGSSNTASCSVIVKPNKIEAVKADKNTQSICIGTDVTFTVDTPYIDLIDREYIQWELLRTSLSLASLSKSTQYSIKPDGTDLLNYNCVKLGGNLNKEKNLSIQFNELGTYILTASMAGKPFQTPTIINVVKAHIEAWNFCDKEENKRSKIGWAQDFYIRVKINGCEGRHLKIVFWYDSRSKSINNRFYKIDSGVEQQDLILGKDGIQIWKISSPKLWTSLQKLVKEHGSSSKSEYARIMFTISEIDTLCDNNKEYKKDHPLHGHIFPQNVDNTTVFIPNKTEYKALFLDSSNKKPLTDIISYSDQAYISLQLINSPQDTQVKDLEIRLWENKIGDDLLLQRTFILSNGIDEEGYIVPHPVNMERITNTKQKNQSKTLPRFFYIQLCKMKDNKVDKIIYTYPEGYKTGKDNDSEIVELQKDDYRGEDIKNQLGHNIYISSGRLMHISSARFMHNWEERLKPKPIFDESKFYNETAEERNKDAQITNTATLDKSKNYFLQLKVAEDPSQQKSRYYRTGKQVGQAGGNSGECLCAKYNLVWGSKVSCEFRKKVVKIAEELKLPQENYEGANWLMTIFAIETGYSFNPTVGTFKELLSEYGENADNKKGGYVGLIQFGKYASTEINKKRSELINLTAEEQLDYVLKYFKLNYFRGKLTSMISLYMAVNYPNNVIENKLSPKDIVYSAPSGAYHQNRVFHKEKRIIEGKEIYEYDNILEYKKDNKGNFILDKNGNKTPSLYGFKDGVTYIWEVHDQLKEIYEGGKGSIFFKRECQYTEPVSDLPSIDEPFEANTWNVIVKENYIGKMRHGKIYVYDQNNKVVFTIDDCLMMGKYRDRLITDGDTPFGRYAIDRSLVFGSGGRTSYGPNYRLRFEPIPGRNDEINRSKRKWIRIHGGRQEFYDKQTKTWIPKTPPELIATHGCIRIFEADAIAFHTWWLNFKKGNKEVKPGVVVVTK